MSLNVAINLHGDKYMSARGTVAYKIKLINGIGDANFGRTA